MITSIRDLLHTAKTNDTLEVYGWIRSRRDTKAGLSFISLHDGSCMDNLQVIAEHNIPNYQSEILKLTSGCAIRAQGVWTASPGKEQSHELHAQQIEVLGWIEDPETYPIAKKKHTFEYLRSVAHLRPRTNTFGAMTRLRHQLAKSIHDYFHAEGFFWVNTPILTSSDCEGAGELFRVSTLDLMNLPRTATHQIDFGQDFFAQPTFLTVSGQLQVESFCLALSKVYTFGPTFRAENSNTSRHLAEFWMVEPEVAFADLNTIAALSEDFLRTVIGDLLKYSHAELAFFNQWIDKSCLSRLEKLHQTAFVHMDYSEAIKTLQNSGQQFEFPVQWGLDLQSEHERYLAEQHVKGPVIIKNYPKDIKAFYMRVNDDDKTCAAMDVLAPGIGEIIGGSQREERLDRLDARIPEHHGALDWYRDLRRFGTVPHGGFGLGFERLLNYVTGMENIRDAIPFPRTPGHIDY
jgi:asparaginyl-tRNA synthetase